MYDVCLINSSTLYLMPTPSYVCCLEGIRSKENDWLLKTNMRDNCQVFVQPFETRHFVFDS